MNNRKKYRILIRRATAEQWTAFNPVLLEGELGLELDTFVISEGVKLYKFKVGNAETAWNDLEYCSFGTNSGGGGGTVSWNDVQNKPTTFAPAPHTHPISEVVDLSTTLATKADLSGGKLVSSQLPAIAISEFLGSVANQSAMLSLVGQVGDWCIRTDEEKAYVITGEDPTQLESWTAIVTPASPVTSVNGQIGEVVLGKSDIGLENVDNTSDLDKPISDATQTALDAKMTTDDYDTDGDGIVDMAEVVPIVVRNSTGSTLLKGQIVYLSGATGNRPNAVLAQANTEATSSKTIGMVIADIPNNTDGQVACIGTLHDRDTSSFTAGDTLWLSATIAGGMVANTPPAEPNHAVFIGFVARSHPTLGRIVLAIQNGYELDELHGVSVPSPSNNNVLKFNSATGLWENGTIAKSEVGLSNVDNTSDANKPVSTATQTALNSKVDKVTGKQLSTEDYTTSEKTKLVGIATGATANSTDAQLRDRATHTGTQAISTISGLQTALDAKISKIFSNLWSIAPSAGITNYSTFLGSSLSAENNVQIPAKAGTYRNFVFRTRSAGTAFTITLRVNGADTSLVINVGAAAGNYSSTGSAVVNEGDLIAWKVVAGAGNGGIITGFSGEC